jgi:hypothetical protein
MWQWAGGVLGFGMLLIFFDWNRARRKEGGLTWTDRQQLFGIFKITLALAILAGLIAWIAG